jgi:dTMP kinase
MSGVIRPALERGQWVVSDRFIDSTYAFQVAAAERCLHAMFRSVGEIVVGSTYPKLTIILDLPPEVAHGRRMLRRDGVEDPAEATRDFAAIRNGLLELAQQEPERCRIINADQPADAVAKDIWSLVEPLL